MVTVIIPAYNRALLLSSSVRSVFAQDYRPIEVIIIDDGSTDQTASVAEILRAEGEKSNVHVRLLQQPNKGVASARNAGMRIAKGQYVQFLDSDDLLHPQKLNFHVGQLAGNPPISYVFSDMIHFHSLPYWKMGAKDHRSVQLRASELYCSFRLLTNVGLYRKSLCDAVGPWNESLKVGEDIEYSLRAMLLCDEVLYFPGGFSGCREHAGARLTDLAKRQGALELRLRCLQAMWTASSQVQPKTKQMVGDKLSILYFRLILDAMQQGHGHMLRDAAQSCSQLKMSGIRRVKLLVLRGLGAIPYRLTNSVLNRIENRAGRWRL